MSCIYVDGSCKPGNDSVGLASVVDGKSKDILCDHLDLLQDFDVEEMKLPVGIRHIISCKFPGLKQQNNRAELLAMVAGLRIAFYNKEYTVLYSDSQIVREYWSLGRIGDQAKKTACQQTMDYIKECTELRQEFETRGGQVKKVSGTENKADLGWHK